MQDVQAQRGSPYLLDLHYDVEYGPGAAAPHCASVVAALSALHGMYAAVSDLAQVISTRR